MPQSEFSAHTLSKKHKILPSAMGRTLYPREQDLRQSCEPDGSAAMFSTDGRLRTHSPVRNMFWGVFEIAARPSIQRQPSQNAEDIGARL